MMMVVIICFQLDPVDVLAEMVSTKALLYFMMMMMTTAEIRMRTGLRSFFFIHQGS